MDLPDFSADSLPGSRIVARLPAILLLLSACFVLGGVAAAYALDVELGVDATGTIQPLTVSQIRAPLAGIISDVRAVTGERVAAGELLIAMDTLQASNQLRRLRLAYDDAVLAYEQATTSIPIEAERQLAEIEGTRTYIMRARAALLQRLVEYGINQDVDEALRRHVPGRHTAIDIAVADVFAAEATLASQLAAYSLIDVSRLGAERASLELGRLHEEIDLVETQIHRSKIRADKAGIVLTEDVHQLAGRSVNAGDLLLEIAGDTAWHAELNIPENRVHRVRVGDPVLLELSALRGQGISELRGAVSFVSPQSTNPSLSAGPTTPVYLAEVTLEGPHRNVAHIFRRGYVVKATIVTRAGPLHTVIRDWISEKIFEAR